MQNILRKQWPYAQQKNKSIACGNAGCILDQTHRTRGITCMIRSAGVERILHYRDKRKTNVETGLQWTKNLFMHCCRGLENPRSHPAWRVAFSGPHHIQRNVSKQTENSVVSTGRQKQSRPSSPPFFFFWKCNSLSLSMTDCDRFNIKAGSWQDCADPGCLRFIKRDWYHFCRCLGYLNNGNI